MHKVVAALVVSAAALLGVSASAAQAVPAVDSPDLAYVKAVIAAHHITTDKYIHIQINDGPMNCGSKGSTGGVGGACSDSVPGSKDVDLIISPKYLHTPLGVHEILHEMGHISGIRDECGAEAFAHAHGSDPNLWSYPQCAGK